LFGQATPSEFEPLDPLDPLDPFEPFDPFEPSDPFEPASGPFLFELPHAITPLRAIAPTATTVDIKRFAFISAPDYRQMFCVQSSPVGHVPKLLPLLPSAPHKIPQVQSTEESPEPSGSAANRLQDTTPVPPAASMAAWQMASPFDGVGGVALPLPRQFAALPLCALPAHGPVPQPSVQKKWVLGGNDTHWNCESLPPHRS
jgi:hypothetical protein